MLGFARSDIEKMNSMHHAAMPCSCSRTQNMLISSHCTNTCNIIWLGLCSVNYPLHLRFPQLFGHTPEHVKQSESLHRFFFLPVCQQGLLHYCMCSLRPLAQLQPFATQDQCIILKEFDKTTPCALLVSCKLHFMLHFCRIMGMQAIQGTCGHAPKSYNKI